MEVVGSVEVVGEPLIKAERISSKARNAQRVLSTQRTRRRRRYSETQREIVKESARRGRSGASGSWNAGRD